MHTKEIVSIYAVMYMWITSLKSKICDYWFHYLSFWNILQMLASLFQSSNEIILSHMSFYYSEDILVLFDSQFLQKFSWNVVPFTIDFHEIWFYRFFWNFTFICYDIKIHCSENWTRNFLLSVNAVLIHLEIEYWNLLLFNSRIYKINFHVHIL